MAAKIYRFFVREEIDGAAQSGARSHVPRQRLSDQAADEADLSLERFLQPAGVRDADQESGASRRVDLSENGPARGADDSGLRTHDGQPRAVAVRSAERRRLGRRPHLDHAVDAAQRGNLFRGVLFPDVKGFRPPDRSMSATDSRVGQRLAQGMSITEATKEGDAESNMMVDRDEDYNTRYGGYKGYLLAFERTKLIPRQPGRDRPTAMVAAAGADTVDKVVDHFVRRFLSVTLTDKERGSSWISSRQARLVSIRPGEKLEESLRELLIWC